MIPLIAASDLEANPAFARLWEYVTKELLVGGDASSRKEDEERERAWGVERRRRSRRINKEKRMRMTRRGGQRSVGDGGVGEEGSVRYCGSREGEGDGQEEEELGQEQELDGQAEDDDGEEGEEEDDDIEDDEGSAGRHEKHQQKPLILDQQLHSLRVARVKRRILRDVLDDVACLDPSAGQSHSEASESHLRSPGAEPPRSHQRSESRIPVSAATGVTTAPYAGAGGPNAEMADVTNQISNLQGQTAEANSSLTSGKTDNVVTERSPGKSIPPDLGELVRVIAAYLHLMLDGSGSPFSSSSSDEVHSRQRGLREKQDIRKDDKLEKGLLYDDMLRFKMNIGPIADAVSSRLVELESSLCVLSDIALENEYGEEDEDKSRARRTQGRLRVSQDLRESVQTQLSHLSDLRENVLPSSLTTLTATLQQLLTLQRQLLQLQVQYLEASKHGVLSRYTMSKIAFLDTVAQAMALKAQVLVLEARKDFEFSPEAERRKEVIRKKMAEVQKEEDELDNRIGSLESVLAEYEAIDPGASIMGRLGKRYEEIEEDMEVVRKDIEMLQRRAVKR
ncbi:hypothetical protein AYO21_09551 [Fonsecaea monophora]|uniref:Uncharacterized protein n=1 Tax=Fonsecaea monophora TaxID=254056 RepID=A0A177EW19_9EURO|nr:hypothetical protein AYO21_09551 [Fonsecaea monophora]KAH0848881.1 hypothetical protein FOPE_03069 [Fonsecaea pedrosoi]OAG36237.1 hypothetical protein AYO21_09551 [Fonsecaea monophora]